ncbi:WXG100 family type VII secretion target [Sciscionella sediminilitoris]|uniref:WXG100 family type VII secretion target n=1 Tax=Sciscionella sediminilitoris TaxID=1445613 RepID=UPI0004DEDC8A|nr:hypothetical protein [Sciscionella sp. SE31]
MTGSDNPLVDKNSRFEWGDYTPIQDGGDQGGTQWWNPFTPGQGYTTDKTDLDRFSHWFEGAPIVNDAVTIAQNIDKAAHGEKLQVHDWIEQFAAGYSLGTYGVALAEGDWGGTAVAPVVSWALEHVKPLRLLLDEVTGNQDTVNAVANTWENMAGALQEASKNYADKVERTVQFWQGDAADAYREHARQLVGALASAGVMCHSWATLIRIVSEIVGIVHDFIRELIAAVVGQIVQDLVEAATVVGAAAIPEQTTGEVVRASGIAAKAVAKAVEGAFKIEGLIPKILTILDEIAKIIERLED